MNVMINDITEDLDTTVAGVQAAITLFLLIMAILMIPCSKLTDRWGRKRCFTAGLVLYGIGALLSAVSPSLGVLILGNSVLEGVGTALLIPPVYILTTLQLQRSHLARPCLRRDQRHGWRGRRGGAVDRWRHHHGNQLARRVRLPGRGGRGDRPAEPQDRGSDRGGPHAPLRRLRSDPVGRRHVLRGVRDPAGRQQRRADGGVRGRWGRVPDLVLPLHPRAASEPARNRCCPPGCSRTEPRTSASPRRTSSGCC